MSNKKNYWKGLEQLNGDDSFVQSAEKEFAEYIPVEEFIGEHVDVDESQTTRRDFLKYLGFGVAAASLAACESPVTKAIPYVNKPEELTPGKANYYATTYLSGAETCPVLVKTREGRPIHIQGNKMSSLTKGAINARVNASILSLYDEKRLKDPTISGNKVSWKQIDAEILKVLSTGQVRILSNSIVSPTTNLLISDFAKNLQGESEESRVQHISYDAVSYSGVLKAMKRAYGEAFIPTFNFSNAKTIVSIGADFLNTWLDSLYYTTDYGTRRNPAGDWMSKHYQFESVLSLTGSNADVRVPVKPSSFKMIVAQLHNMIKTNGVYSEQYPVACKSKLLNAAKDLLKAGKYGLVVCDSNDEHVQGVVLEINKMLGAEEITFSTQKRSFTKSGEDDKLISLVKEMQSGTVDTLIVWGQDPTFNLPAGLSFDKALAKVKTVIAFSSKMNGIAKKAKYVCPDSHYLESWNDALPVSGNYSLAQPVIEPLFNTRQAQDSLLKWSGNSSVYSSYLKTNWGNSILKENELLDSSTSWNTVLHDGVFAKKVPARVIDNLSDQDVISDQGQADDETIVASYSAIKMLLKGVEKNTNSTEIVFYQKTGVGQGEGADNPWLQELPDPITKITWDNYITMNPVEMTEKGYQIHLGEKSPANLVSINVGGQVIDSLPVVAQPGMPKGVVGLALGYGVLAGKDDGKNAPVGKNAYPLLAVKNNAICYHSTAVITDIEGSYDMAATQTHHTFMGRDSVIKETTLETYKKGDRNAYNPPHLLAMHDSEGHVVKTNVNDVDLWSPHAVENIGHRWGMTVDMNSCIGCGSCVTACTSENNVPVVGKDEVRRGREMHWLRIDRYYSSDMTMEKGTEEGMGKIDTYLAMEVPSENPQVVFQPMMCQHCNHAGCETVCPVAATSHSLEGLNMMAYNRCIGTRYCANNCAYKVRRFNWFNYIAYDKFTAVNPAQDDLGRLVLNPDVTVRSRGVMEKCSMCVQRIQEGKLNAKVKGEKVIDGSIQTACMAACSTSAITFGDLNDSDSVVHTNMKDDRSYRVIEEVGQQPNIYYLTKVRNQVENA